MNAVDFNKLSGAIGIFGYGVTGKAVAKFCKEKCLDYRVFDEFGNDTDKFSKQDAQCCKIIVRSPSFSSSHPWVVLAKNYGCGCITELDLAAMFWNGKILAVTGTNGKTTTTEFLAYALSRYGKTAVACGNIGNTFIEMVSSEANSTESWAVVEVSSFQMDDSQIFRPNFVIWTNFAPDHLDVHKTLLNYCNCKANLIRRVKGNPKTHCFVGKSVDDFIRKEKIADVLGLYSVCSSNRALAEETVFNIAPQRENFALIQKFWEENNFPNNVLISAAKDFKLPPHRLHLVAQITTYHPKKKSIEFWNDSKATNFHALQAALGAFNKEVILIAGGKSKNESIEEFLRIIDNKVKFLLCVGDFGQVICDAIENSATFSKKIHCKVFQKRDFVPGLMEDIVRYASEIAEDGDIVLLSPGFSSLDWFTSYAERGKMFEDGVLCLNFINK